MDTSPRGKEPDEKEEALPNPAYEVTDHRAWLLADELPLWLALECEDLTGTWTVHVKLAEYQTDEMGRAKRQPHRSKLTAEQHTRLAEASKHVSAFARCYDGATVQALLQRLAYDRWTAAGSPGRIENDGAVARVMNASGGL